MVKKVYGVEEFLERPKRLEEEIQGDIDHIASLRSIVERTTTRLSFTAGTNPSKDDKAFEKVMIQIAEEEKKLAEKKSRLIEVRQEVEEFILLLPDKNQREMLRYKFLMGFEMQEILSRTGVSKTKGYDLLNEALQEATKIYYGIIRNDSE